MAWTVEFTPHKEQVGTLVARWTGQLPEDEWTFPLSVDLAQVNDLTPYAEKVKALKAAHDAEKSKPAKYQPALDALAAALNEGK